MDYHSEDITIKMEPPLEISDSSSETESESEAPVVIQNISHSRKQRGSMPATFERSELVIGTSTYNTTVVESNFVGRESRENVTWEQARFIDFMSSHILQLSPALQNEFLDGVMGLYLEIAKRNQ